MTVTTDQSIRLLYVDLHQNRCAKILSFIGNATPNGGIALGEHLKRTTEETAVVLLDILLHQHLCWKATKFSEIYVNTSRS